MKLQYASFLLPLYPNSEEQDELNRFLRGHKTIQKLKLNLKPKICGKVNDGVPFLGFLVKPNGIFLQQKTKNRYKDCIAEIEHKRKQKFITDAEAGLRLECVTAHLLIARSRDFRNNVLHRRFFGD